MIEYRIEPSAASDVRSAAWPLAGLCGDGVIRYDCLGGDAVVGVGLTYFCGQLTGVGLDAVQGNCYHRLAIIVLAGVESGPD